MSEVVRYIKAYYKAFSKLTEERYAGRKFFDLLSKNQIPKFHKMEDMTEDLLNLI
jgi:hypothetical protein